MQDPNQDNIKLKHIEKKFMDNYKKKLKQALENPSEITSYYLLEYMEIITQGKKLVFDYRKKSIEVFIHVELDSEDSEKKRKIIDEIIRRLLREDRDGYKIYIGDIINLPEDLKNIIKSRLALENFSGNRLLSAFKYLESKSNIDTKKKSKNIEFLKENINFISTHKNDNALTSFADNITTRLLLLRSDSENYLSVSELIEFFKEIDIDIAQALKKEIIRKFITLLEKGIEIANCLIKDQKHNEESKRKINSIKSLFNKNDFQNINFILKTLLDLENDITCNIHSNLGIYNELDENILEIFPNFLEDCGVFRYDSRINNDLDRILSIEAKKVETQNRLLEEDNAVKFSAKKICSMFSEPKYSRYKQREEKQKELKNQEEEKGELKNYVSYSRYNISDAPSNSSFFNFFKDKPNQLVLRILSEWKSFSGHKLKDVFLLLKKQEIQIQKEIKKIIHSSSFILEEFLTAQNCIEEIKNTLFKEPQFYNIVNIYNIIYGEFNKYLSPFSLFRSFDQDDIFGETGIKGFFGEIFNAYFEKEFGDFKEYMKEKMTELSNNDHPSMYEVFGNILSEIEKNQNNKLKVVFSEKLENTERNFTNK